MLSFLVVGVFGIEGQIDLLRVLNDPIGKLLHKSLTHSLVILRNLLQQHFTEFRGRSHPLLQSHSCQLGIGIGDLGQLSSNGIFRQRIFFVLVILLKIISV